MEDGDFLTSSDEYEDDENFIEEGGEYSNKSEFSKALKASEAMTRILDFRARPMVAGYDNTIMSNDGTMHKTKVPDSRQAYISSIIVLRNLLHPECLRDKMFMEFESVFKDKLKELFNLYCYEDFEIDKYHQDGKFTIRKNGRKYMPEMDEYCKSHSYNFTTRDFATVKGYWNNNVNAYLNNCVELYDELFAELNLLIDRINYFKPKMTF